MLADLTEALIGAVYLTFGLDTVRPAVIEVFTEHIRFAEKSYVDYKTELQELLARSARTVAYRLVAVMVPIHGPPYFHSILILGYPGAGYSYWCI